MSKIELKNKEIVSSLGMGTLHMGDDPANKEEVIATLRYGIDFGLNVIDTAESYGNGASEKLIGEAIQPYNRDDLYLVSKFSPSNASKNRLEKSLDASLSRLDTDYLDLYLYHWPGNTPLEETVSELKRMQNKDKIKAWGVSSFDLDLMKKLQDIPYGEECVVNQLYYNLVERGIEYELKPYLDSKQVATMAYSPLVTTDDSGQNLLEHPVLLEVAEELEVSVYQVLILFSLHQDNVIPIPKTSSLSHMKENCESLNLSLTNEQYQKIDQAFPAPDHSTPLALGW